MQKLLLPLIGLLIVFGSCRHKSTIEVVPADICGCMDTLALNNNPDATKCDPTQCHYAIDSVTGVYDIIDTFTTYGSMGPVVTIGSMQITVTRGSAKTLLFDQLIKCMKCENGEIPYAAQSHTFHYVSYSDPYTSENGDGQFIGDSIRYYVATINSYTGNTPFHKGRGVKRK